MKRRTLRAISLITLGLLWEAAGRTQNPHLLPPLSSVFSAWIELLLSGQLLKALGVSLQALALGFVLSVLLGVPLSLLVVRYGRIESFIYIYMTVLLNVAWNSYIMF